MAQISNFSFDNTDVTETLEGFKNSSNFPNPADDAETRLQFQKLLSQIRYYINNTLVGNINGKAEDEDFDEHLSDTDNPHSVTKTQVGLGNVDNTSDANKPVSTAQQSALDLKTNISDIKDNLTSTDTNKPLSANQGKVLNEAKQDKLPTLVNNRYLHVNSNGVLEWSSPQGAGTVTSITAGTGLTGGTITSDGTIAVDTTAIQEKLTSGTNIKTVNGESILGSGDLDVGISYEVVSTL